MTGYSAGSGLTRVGSSVYNGAPAIGTTNLVSGAANVNGVIVRSFVLSQGAGNACVLYGGAAQIGAASNNYVAWTGAVLVPAGQALAVNTNAAGAGANVSYDIL